jgi:hypothetical protein
MMAPMIEMAATCLECGRAFEAHPVDFLYHATGLEAHEAPAGILRMGQGYWVECGEVPATGPIHGYCRGCADEVAARDHEEYRNGNWARRDMEDEQYVWDR